MLHQKVLPYSSSFSSYYSVFLGHGKAFPHHKYLRSGYQAISTEKSCTPWKLKKAVGKHDGNSGLGFSNKRRKKNALFLFICKQTMVRKHYYYYETFPRRKVLLILNYMVGSLYFYYYYYYLVSKRKCLRIYY
ncbi:hypothetical protein ES332_A07G045000v1 [Gossypium tomentosum]|uniref:Uncharacterized protein n=1 Tax=Gossypium tomentosum TaxID=34277 RepID=A0A5D2PNQ4_GOSTO|nr:hypothetical protein ES332_A07G045000v1 [Gossypium tomentosum]